MKTINNLTTRAKLICSFGVILILLAVITGIALVNITGLARSEAVLHEKYFQVSLKLQEVNSIQNYIRAQMLFMMLTSDQTNLKTTEELIQSKSSEIDTLLVDLAKTDKNDSVFQTNIQNLQSALADWRQTQAQQIGLIYAGNAQGAMRLAETVSDSQFDQVHDLAVKMSNNQDVQKDNQLLADQRSAKMATITMIVIGVFAILVTIVLVLVLNRTIAIPLTLVAQNTEKIATGDLTIMLPDIKRGDEVGILSEAFKKMLEMLRRAMSDTAEAVGMLGSSASEILASTTQVASGTAETAAAINETTTTIEEVRQAVQLTAQKAQSVSDTAERVAEVSRDGMSSVKETTNGMSHIKEQMDAIAQTVVRLSEQGQSIGGIIASVTDLADQSNLLSVNAAIEAAKAGEQGAGFAVVAQEIKNLAEQSKQATSQIRSILNDLQNATTNAVLATEQGSKAVDSGVELTTRTGESIRVLSEASEEALQAASQILASSQQQVIGMDQIGMAMENINQAGAQNAASMKQMEVAAQDLHELGQKLKVLVELFKV